MKNIWILNHYAQEPSRPGSTRHFSLAKHLLNYGWCAHIIAASVELNTQYQRLGLHQSCRLDLFEGVPFLWIKTHGYEGNGMGRIMNMFSYSIRVLLPKYTKGLPSPDVIIGSSVHPLAACSGAILAKRYNVPFIFEVRDLWPQTLVDYGKISQKSIIARLLYWLESKLYKFADKIVVLLPHATDYLTRHGGDREKIVWLPNGVDLCDFVGISSSSKANGDGVFTLMYFGAHGNANGLDNMIQAMALVQKRILPQPIRMRLIGEGPLKPALIEQAHQLKLDNVYFEPPVPKSSVPSVAAEADAFVITPPNLPLYRFGISPNKLFDYMAAARPTLIAANASNNPIEEANAGITVHPGDPSALAGAIEKMVCISSAERVKMGKNARSYVEKNYDYLVLAKKLADVLEEVCRK